MGTEVLTRSWCDRCGTIDERSGAEGDTPPVFWSRFTLNTRLNAPGWTKSDDRKMTLCRRCSDAVLDFARTAPTEINDD
jgi:hypothetical protein